MRIDVLLGLRVFRRPWLWLGLWLLMVVAVIVLSLMPKPPIPVDLTVFKVDHLIAYFALAAFAVQLCVDRSLQFITGLALIGLGIGLELAQGYLTNYRDMSTYDAFVDTLGVAIGLATTWTPMVRILQRIDAKLRF